jgi:hypothetical protein
MPACLVVTNHSCAGGSLGLSTRPVKRLRRRQSAGRALQMTVPSTLKMTVPSTLKMTVTSTLKMTVPSTLKIEPYRTHDRCIGLRQRTLRCMVRNAQRAQDAVRSAPLITQLWVRVHFRNASPFRAPFPETRYGSAPLAVHEFHWCWSSRSIIPIAVLWLSTGCRFKTLSGRPTWLDEHGPDDDAKPVVSWLGSASTYERLVDVRATQRETSSSMPSMSRFAMPIV